LELYVGSEIGEGGVYHVGDHDEVDGFVGIVRADAQGQVVFGHGEFFVGHPAGDFAELLDARVDVAGILDYGRKAIEYGAADGFGPGEGLLR
jgi:hypothetical protein